MKFIKLLTNKVFLSNHFIKYVCKDNTQIYLKHESTTNNINFTSTYKIVYDKNNITSNLFLAVNNKPLTCSNNLDYLNSTHNHNFEYELNEFILIKPSENVFDIKLNIIDYKLCKSAILSKHNISIDTDNFDNIFNNLILIGRQKHTLTNKYLSEALNHEQFYLFIKKDKRQK